MLLNTFRRLFSNSQNRKARRAYTRPQLLQLEGRIVPATFTVLNTNDSGANSLRQAIIDANLTSANDDIVFNTGVTGTITLTIALPNIIDAGTGAGAGTLTITGPGASSLNISANSGNFSIFSINSGGNLAISGVTVTGANFTGNGGAFNNFGTLAVSNSTLSGNTASFGGGGIYNTTSGTVTVSNSTLSGNTAGGGGGIYNGGTLTVSNSTLSGNSAIEGGGGGIYNGGTLTVSNSTLSGNSAIEGGGIYNGTPAALNIANTIIANSTSGGDFAGPGTVGTNLNNLVEDGSLPGTSEIIGDPLLGPLQNNGGPTFTMALLSGSPAIAAGNATISNATPISGLDQRGYARSSTLPSIGAYEFYATPTVTIISPTSGSTAGGTVITITGTNFVAGPTIVTIGGNAATAVIVVNSTTITATTPAGSIGTARVEVTTAGGTNSGNTLFTYAAAGVAPAFTSVASTTFTFGSAGTYTITASGTPAPTFVVTSGALPSGVTLSSPGVLSGTPTAAGTFTFTITAANTISPDTTQVFTLTVNKASTTTTLASTTASVFGESVTFTATVNSSTATGTVEFFNGSTSLGSVALNAGSATSAAITNFGVSTHSITAVYSGDSSFITSTSSAVSQVVNLGLANTPTFGTTTSNDSGFTVQISNYDANFAYAGTATPSGTVVVISNTGLVTVSRVAANTSSTATITTTRANYVSGSAQVTATSNIAPLVTSTPPLPSSGGTSTVTLRDPVTGEETGTAVPFPGFNGPVKVVSGDFNNDGVADIFAAAGFGGGPAIAILNSQTGEVMESFFAFDPAFTGGVFVAVQDVNGDGILDIIASAGPGGGPEVRIFNGASLNVLRAFYAYDQSFTGGVSVASIDFNNDGILDLVTGAGPGGGPHVKVFDGATNAIISQWYAYPASFTGGVFVAVGDIGNDGTFEVVTGAGTGGAPVVAVWDPYTGALLAQFMAYAESFTGGVRVGINDGNGDGVADILTGAGPGGGPQVNVFSFPALDLLFSFYSGEPTNTGGVFVG